MILPPDIGKASPGPETRTQAAPPDNWREALMILVATRFALIQIESKEAAIRGAQRAMWVAAAGGFAFFFWALLLAGGVSMIAKASGWPWDCVAIAAAACHLITALVLSLKIKSPASISFPVTRAEFQKDREWIENFHKTKKSND